MENSYRKEELLNTLVRLINELDVAFDYVDNSVIDTLNIFVRQCRKDNTKLQLFVNQTIDILEPFIEQIKKLNSTTSKVHKQEYDFLDNVVLFDGRLSFAMFKYSTSETITCIPSS